MNSNFLTIPASASTVANTSKLGLRVGLTPRAANMSSGVLATTGRGLNLGNRHTDYSRGRLHVNISVPQAVLSNASQAEWILDEFSQLAERYGCNLTSLHHRWAYIEVVVDDVVKDVVEDVVVVRCQSQMQNSLEFF